MGVFDNVLCNNDLFGTHKGETHQTKDLNPTGAAYEITPSGRLEQFECSYEERSNPDAQGWKHLIGSVTPVFTGGRQDVNYHGWLNLSSLGRAKFTDGALVAFEPYSDGSREMNLTATEVAGPAPQQAVGPDLRARHFLPGGGTNDIPMTVTMGSSQEREPRSIPFLEKLIKSDRGLDGVAQNEWIDDVERRLRDVLSRINPGPVVSDYFVDRVNEGLTIYTITAKVIDKCVIGPLSAGDWPCWDEIVDAVPEFDFTMVVFDAVSRYEWSRRWDMRMQERRIHAEFGLVA